MKNRLTIFGIIFLLITTWFAIAACSNPANDTGKIQTTDPGIPQSHSGNSVIRSVVWGNGKFVAVSSSGGGIAYSTDGVTWVAVTETIFGKEGIDDIAWGNGKFIAVGGNPYMSGGRGRIAYSPDGITWSEVAVTTFGAGNGIYAVAWGNGKFVAVGDGGGAYSSDGVTWTAINGWLLVSSNESSQTVAWCNDRFVVGGIHGAIAYSSDGVTWTAVANSPFDIGMIYSSVASGAIYGIAWGNGKFVTVGQYGVTGNPTSRIAYSSDGVNWAVVTDSTFGTSTIAGVAWGNGKFIANGIGGKMASSSDGVTWTPIVNNIFGANTIFRTAWGNGKFVAVGGSSRIAYSMDGVNWVAVKDSKFP